MLRSTIYFRVIKTEGNIRDFNGYKFQEVEAELPRDIKVTLLIKVRDIEYLEEGKTYKSTMAVLRGDPVKTKKVRVKGRRVTRKVYNNNIRVDSFCACTEKEYKKQKETFVCINGFIKNPMSKVRYKGPERNPYIVSTLYSLKNEYGRPFGIPVIAHYKNAIKLGEYSGMNFFDIKGRLGMFYGDKAICIYVTEMTHRGEVKKA